MLPKSGRIRLTREFERIFASRQSYAGRFARLAFVRSEQPASRCGIVISTKVSKRAVVRNKLRRRIRAVFAEILPQLSPAKDVAVICFPSAAKADFVEFRSDLLASFSQVYKKSL